MRTLSVISALRNSARFHCGFAAFFFLGQERSLSPENDNQHRYASLLFRLESQPKKPLRVFSLVGRIKGKEAAD
jgi:hypothetical protein